ncbi:hypothetical protein [Youngiibacter multivorans]|uniref:Uncharacterized protein n=1 Tax=Youngiibacter multivorans TaxID=937251 RepID=A0ABS4G141_9CLOT|nr:hypothetical protein [Youngiibacter multivorans]MBP1918255.1 hypothetical protein [Youngiibacter multivorans]
MVFTFIEYLHLISEMLIRKLGQQSDIELSRDAAEAVELSV